MFYQIWDSKGTTIIDLGGGGAEEIFEMNLFFPRTPPV